MSQQLVQVNFQYKGSGEEYEEAAASVAEMFASLPGLIWKIWLQNHEKKEGGESTCLWIVIPWKLTGIHPYSNTSLPVAIMRTLVSGNMICSKHRV